MSFLVNNSNFKKSSIVFVCVAFLGLSHFALGLTLETDVYGEANISRDFVDVGDDDWQSYYSRLGIKGNYKFTEDLSVIYQLEQQVDLAHGNTNTKTLFSTRNSFIGVQGKFGKLFWGAHDSPFKKSQGKVNLFNDQAGDMKSLLVGEVRALDSFFYHSPVFGESFSIQTMYVPSDSNFDSSSSLAVFYNDNNITAALAFDSDMRKNNKTAAKTKVYDSMRSTIQYTLNNWKIGAIYQQSEQQNKIGAKKENGYLASLSYKLKDWKFLAEHGKSDIINLDAKSNQLGVEYFFDKKKKVYVYWWDIEAGSKINTIISLGVEAKF